MKEIKPKKTKTVKGWVVVDKRGRWEGGAPLPSKYGGMIEFRFYRADYKVDRVQDWFVYALQGYRPVKVTMTYEV